MNNDVKIKVEKKLTVKPEGLFEGVVKPLGNGAAILFKKRYIGKQVYVIIKDDIKEEK